MSEIDNLLKAALQAQSDGEAALCSAQEQHQALLAAREETAAKLLDAKSVLKTASGALAKGGGERAFHAAMDQVATLEARLRAFDEIAIPEAGEACEAAGRALPSFGYLAALKLRSQAQSQLVPLYERHAELMSAEAALLTEVEDVHATLLQEFRSAYPTLFHADRRIALGDLLKAVPPAVRKLHALLFDGPRLEEVHENRFLPFSDDALAAFRARVDREPSEGELARFNPAAAPPAAAYVSDPRPEPGPAQMRGIVLHTPGAM